MIDKEGKTPKILVCSVNAWNSKIGDNTFPVLLQNYDKNKIANLFIREENPDSNVCDNYFRISENKVLKSIFRRKIKTGEKIDLNGNADNAAEQKEQFNRYNGKNRFYYFKLFLREIVWKFGRWKSRELNEFLEDFSPDIVIYEMSRYIHLNNVVKYILRKTGAKGIGCYWDDTFTYKQEKGIRFKLLRFFQRRNLKKLAAVTTDFFAITPKTKQEADKFFGIDSVVLTKPILTEKPFSQPLDNDVINILYTGNLGIGRLKTVKILANAIQKYDRLRLNVYTNSFISEKDKKYLDGCNVILHPAVSQGEVLALQSEADVLLFVESIDKGNKIARLSFSTKITDYYSAGRCILAIGNLDSASMELFKENDSAVIAENEDQIYAAINVIVDYHKRLYYAEKAYSTGLKNHSVSAIEQKFYSVLLREEEIKENK